MQIGIIGAGMIGGNLARLFAKAGHQVMVSFSRSPEKLTALAREIGTSARTGSPAAAVRCGEVVVLSVHFSALGAALAQTDPADFEGKVVLDTNNPFDIKLPAGTTGAAEITRRLPGIQLVKAFNTLGADLLLTRGFQEPRTVVPYAGDHPGANQSMARLIADAGFEPLAAGGTEAVSLLEPGGPFFGKTLTPDQARTVLEGARSQP
jgi:predicted dinucleotide-binding enzyme